ncbi:hypothetical protein V7O62_09550 [Methanolobus sp. ZRKC2]|uniref:hypothetical protein n=1 Tax=Methanolobus sp. ZRKC2 TaxID=3125783 RepID=UPI00324F93AF
MSPEYKNISDKAIKNGPRYVEKMRVQIQIIDFRSLAILIVLILLWLTTSFIDHLYRTIWTYLIYALFTNAILVLLFLQSSKKISIDNERLQIHDPISGKKILSKDKIQKVTYTDNFNYKHRNIQYIVVGIAALITWSIQISSLYNSVSKYGFEDGTNVFMPTFMILLFSFLLYRLYNCSRYQKIIKIDINPGEITLYPENESKYLLLKEKLDLLN